VTLTDLVLHAGSFNQQLYQVLVYFFYALAAVVAGPLYPIALTLLYYDQRSRKEGYDVERMMEEAGLLIPSGAGVTTSAVPSAIDAGTSQDLSLPVGSPDRYSGPVGS
jgi:hypothetical protein